MAVINTTYDANEVNQYSSIRKNEESAFVPTFDAAGNQTLVRTATGTWSVTYNAENRPVIFQKTADSVTTRITCTYDYMGRRATKKVEEITTDAEGNETTAIICNHRFIYRGYLQIGCCDLTRTHHPCLWLITWDPTQPVATRPLAIQKDGTWYTYGWDLTKNICEIFGQNGYIRSTYAYTPFGSVTANGDVNQPIQWSSEYYDSELALVYYNYRHYNPTDGRWINRDPIAEQGGRNLYGFVNNRCNIVDYYGLVYEEYKKVFIPTTGRIGTVKARIKDGKVEILHQKWLLPNFWNICTSPKQTSDFAWLPATDDDIKIFFTKTGDSFQVEKDPSVLFARSMGVQFKNIKVKEQMKIGNSLVFTALTGEVGVGIRLSRLIVSNLKSVIHFVNIAKFKFRRCPNTLFEKLSLDLLYSSKLKNVKIIKDALHDPRYIDFEKAVFYIKGFNERVEIHYLIHKVTRLRIDFKFK